MKTLGLVVLVALQVLLAGGFAGATPVTTTVTVDAGRFFRMDEAGLLQTLKSPVAGDRQCAAYEIGRRKLTRDLGAVQSLFSDPSHRVRADAAVVAYSFGDKGAAALLRQLLDDANPWVASRAAQPLVGDGDAQALEVTRKLRKNKDPLVRMNAFAALWGSPDQEISYKALAEALNDQSSGVRVDATRALGDKQTVRALDMLTARLPQAPNEYYERFIVASQIAKSRLWASAPVLIRMVTDSDPEVAYQAARKLTDLHPLSEHLTSADITPIEARAAADKWRQWWNQESAKHAADALLPTSATR